MLFYGGHPAEAALIARQTHERGYDLQLVGSDNLNSEYFLQVAGPAVEGVRFVAVADARTHEAAAPIVAKFRAEGYEPEGYTLYAYAVIQVWAQAVEKRAASMLLPLWRCCITTNLTRFSAGWGLTGRAT